MASAWQTFWHITLPLLMPTMTVVIVLALIRAVQVFDQVFVLTGGGPGTATLYMVQYIYQTAFRDGQLGYASALAMVLFLLMLLGAYTEFHTPGIGVAGAVGQIGQGRQ